MSTVVSPGAVTSPGTKPVQRRRRRVQRRRIRLEDFIEYADSVAPRVESEVQNATTEAVPRVILAKDSKLTALAPVFKPKQSVLNPKKPIFDPELPVFYAHANVPVFYEHANETRNSTQLPGFNPALPVFYAHPNVTVFYQHANETRNSTHVAPASGGMTIAAATHGEKPSTLGRNWQPQYLSGSLWQSPYWDDDQVFQDPVIRRAPGLPDSTQKIELQYHELEEYGASFKVHKKVRRSTQSLGTLFTDPANASFTVPGPLASDAYYIGNGADKIVSRYQRKVSKFFPRNDQLSEVAPTESGVEALHSSRSVSSQPVSVASVAAELNVLNVSGRLETKEGECRHPGPTDNPTPANNSNNSNGGSSRSPSSSEEGKGWRGSDEETVVPGSESVDQGCVLL